MSRPAEDTLRAPDVSVGGVSDEDGWAQEPPKLAVEVADTGTEHRDLQVKIQQYLKAGTKYVWVIHNVGEPRVEVYSSKGPTASSKQPKVRTYRRGEVLKARGVLQNAVPVDALFDPSKAEHVVLANLLNRQGVESLEALESNAHAKGKAEGLRVAIVALCQVLDIPLNDMEHRQMRRMKVKSLNDMLDTLCTTRVWST